MGSGSWGCWRWRVYRWREDAIDDMHNSVASNQVSLQDSCILNSNFAICTPIYSHSKPPHRLKHLCRLEGCGQDIAVEAVEKERALQLIAILRIKPVAHRTAESIIVWCKHSD
jgi:hypothetical protein